MRDAVAALVRDGDTVVIEGFTHLICFAAGHEIIRQRRRELTLCRLTPDLIYDQMIAAGCARKLVFSWAGNPGAGSLHAFRRAVEGKGGPPLELEEYSHFGMVGRLSAGAARLPFWPMRNYMGTDLPVANPRIATVQCPYTGERLATVPALNPDVTIVHAQRADAQGNTQIWGLLGVQKEAAFASSRVIVVVEELVDERVIRADPNRTVIPGLAVDAVVVEPWGAHPSYAQGYYDRDNEFYVGWEKISREPAALAAYLDEFVYGVRDRSEYVARTRRARAAPGRHAGVRRGELWVLSTPAMPVTYTPAEMMAAVAARELRDGEVVFVGIGLPNLACNLARATHAPNLVLIYESGAVGAVPERLPVSIGDPSLVTGSLMVCGMADVFQSLLQNGRIEVGFLGGAQIDRYGNINTTVVGSYDRPEVRLPGSGGATEIAIHARRTVVISRLSRRAFPEQVDFVTSPGHLVRGRTRRELGMPGAGPVKVVTDKAILEADPASGELVLAALYPGVTADEVSAGVGWPLRVRPAVSAVEPPSAKELGLLRDVLDPHRLYLKG